MTVDPVAAVTEQEATGEVAEIFADIRAVLRVGVVNLIWRHLATIPGALPWAWGVLRPRYLDGTIASAAVDLRLIVVHMLPRFRFTPEVFAAAGLGEADLSAIRDVLAAYDRTNSKALIALSALRGSLEGRLGASESKALRRPPVAGDPEPSIALPRLLSLGDMAPSTAALVQSLNRIGARDASPIVASMYRHLAHWPAYLALAWTVLAPRQADGRLPASIADVASNAASISGRLVDSLAPSERPAHAAATKKAVEPFVNDVIARMVVICALLRDVTGPQARLL